MDLKPTLEASSPVLVQITEIDNQLPKNRYIVYCENPTQPGSFQPLDSLTEITLISKRLKLKILDLEMVDSLPAFKSA